MKGARAWKRYYEEERRSLDLDLLLVQAADVELPPSAALVVPHTRLAVSGMMTAAAAVALVRSGAREVLALGVLHGCREEDRALVSAARAGDPRAVARLRRVHAAGSGGYAAEEFSLDGLRLLVELAARKLGRVPPRFLERYPFLAGEQPESLPGFDELAELAARGAALVATGDLVHHGAGYGTPEPERLPIGTPGAMTAARGAVCRSFELLGARDLPSFAAHCTAVRSDFRDVGPVLAALLPEAPSWELHDLALVDYAEILAAPPPTWVAAALVSMGGP